MNIIYPYLRYGLSVRKLFKKRFSVSIFRDILFCVAPVMLLKDMRCHLAVSASVLCVYNYVHVISLLVISCDRKWGIYCLFLLSHSIYRSFWFIDPPTIAASLTSFCLAAVSLQVRWIYICPALPYAYSTRPA